jgi:predicted aldo/keto reductase-like oxidoreductase
MQKRRLGKTNLQVSVIGFGCIKFSGMTQREVDDSLNLALDSGLNLLDTSRNYGDSEEKIGKAVARRRDEFYISTKKPIVAKDEMRKAIETSLKNLRTDYVDLYGIHTLARSGRQGFEEVTAAGGGLEALEEAKEAGKVRHIYFSCHRDHEIMKDAIASGRFEACMLAYNALNDELVDEKVLPFASEHDIGVMLMKPLAGGALVTPPEAATSDQKKLFTATQALRFVLANPHVTTACVGMQSVDEVRENAKVGEKLVEMSEEEKQEVIQLAESLSKDICRGCGYCMPCPEGIPIPIILRHEMYFTRFGMQDWARHRYSMVEVKADNCVDCGECEEKCPYHLPIRQKLKEVHPLLSRTG